MQVVLLERVEKLGDVGEVATVRNGYARNFLIPQYKAVRATAANIAAVEEKKAELVKRNDEKQKTAQSMAKAMKDLSVIIIRQAGESGQLYGSVATRDIAAAIKEAGYSIDKNQVRIPDPIKFLGIYTVGIVLHAEVQIDVTVNVAKTEDEAKAQVIAAKVEAEADALAEKERAEEAAILEAEKVLKASNDGDKDAAA